MTQQVLALKWRPRTFNEVIGQPHVVQALSNGLDNNRLHHAFLFTGTRGVGKTTLARIFAKSLNCEKGVSSSPCGVCSICKEVDEGRFVDLIEIDAASRTRVEDTREILDNVQYAPTRGRYKIYLIDEVHMLSNSSFNALLKTLEEPPSHVKFLLATTDPQKLPVTVLSRCLRFQLKRIQDDEIAEQLEKILSSEGIPFDSSAVKLIAKAGDGSMRDALSLLDQAIAYTGQNVAYEPTHEMLGLIDTQYLQLVLSALASREASELISALGTIRDNGLDYHRFLEDLIDAFHLLTMMQISEEVAEHESLEYRTLAQQFKAEDLQLFYQIALNGRKDLQNHPNSEVGFEMTLLRMLYFAPQAPIDTATSPKDKKNVEDKSDESGKSLLVASHHQDSDNPKMKENLGFSQKKSIDNEGALQTSISIRDSIKDSIKELSVTDLSISDDNAHPHPHPQSLGDLVVEARETRKAEESQDALEKATEIDLPWDEPSSKEILSVKESDHSIDALKGDIGKSTIVSDASGRDAVAEDEISMRVNDQNRDDRIDEIVEVPQSINVDSPINADQLVDNEAWLTLVSELSLESVLSGIAHSLVFKSFKGNLLTLERPLSVKDFRVDEAETRLALAISAQLGKEVTCKIEYVETLAEENFHERVERLDVERAQRALQDLLEDDVVQYLQREHGARLLERTVKSLVE
ncbi:DNA polymerase III subunit gamma/tau [Ignatzschineria indica]|uniref:DNA polymerase III subunit gamma/tau n=1 Tax=Ignatzschineria indica TaxID=472583 RepID=UPI0025781A22|nr:DNA polymerase III subunit gamma/tau [Ignatzschineria indica]MDM1545612.1 DNA polymerase III subunit gamma/tau [Ignatzschineria indica]